MGVVCDLGTSLRQSAIRWDGWGGVGEGYGVNQKVILRSSRPAIGNSKSATEARSGEESRRFSSCVQGEQVWTVLPEAMDGLHSSGTEPRRRGSRRSDAGGIKAF
jgi:hypothetical protein